MCVTRGFVHLCNKQELGFRGEFIHLLMDHSRARRPPLPPSQRTASLQRTASSPANHRPSRQLASRSASQQASLLDRSQASSQTTSQRAAFSQCVWQPAGRQREGSQPGGMPASNSVSHPAWQPACQPACQPARQPASQPASQPAN